MEPNLEHLLLSYAAYDFLVSRDSLKFYKDSTVIEMCNILKNELVKRKIFPEGL